MKRAYLFLNGRLKGSKKFYFDFIKNNSGDIFCADGGANFCYELNLIPEEIWGDLDSIKDEVKKFYEPKKVKFKKFQKEKDYTDAELILEKIKDEYNEIFCIAGLGGSLDHELTNINLLEKYDNLIFLTQKEEIFKINKKYKFENCKGGKISFIIFSDEIKKLSLSGFKYEVKDLDLEKGDTRCISNIIINDNAEIKIENGSLLCIKNNKR